MENLTVNDKKTQFYILLCVSIGAFMANLDLAIANIALPTISRDFNVTPTIASRIIIAYSLMEASLLLAFGKLADLKGSKKLFMWGLGLFTIASFFCGISENIGMLTLSRVIQGIGGAMIFSVMMAIISIYFPKDVCGKAMGIVTTAAAAGVALGPPLGGFIISLSHWRWIFFINIPIGIFSLIIGHQFLPKKHPSPAKTVYDLGGAIATFVSLSAFVYLMHKGPEVNWLAPGIGIAFIILIISLIYLLYEERRAAAPIIDLDLLKNGNFLMSALGSIPSFIATSGLLFVIPFYLEDLKKLDVQTSGLIIMAVAFGQLMGPYAGGLVDKFGSRKVLLFGIFMTLLSFILLLTLNGSSGIVIITTALGLFGISLGFSKAPNVALALSFASLEKKGIAAGLMGALRSLGIILGVLFFGTILSHTISQGKPLSDVDPASMSMNPALLLKAFHNTFIFGILISIAALILIVMVKEMKFTKN